MFKILDLFCGAGGFSYGFEKNQHFKTLIGLDFQQSAIDTFQHNFSKSVGICGDISNKEIQQQIINLSKKLNVNMVIGGPPCQGFSLKGKKLGLNDERNFLFLEYLKIVKEINPEIFIIENVKNLYNTCQGYFKNEIINIIQNLGYYVSCKVLNAKYFNVPQHRERIFFIAYKHNLLELPEENDNYNFITVKDAISDLSYLNSGEGNIISDYKNAPQSEYQKLLRGDYLQYHKASNHSDLAIQKLKLIPAECGKEYLPQSLHGKQKFSTTWGRLSWNNVSPTIDTRFDTPSNGTNSHPYLNRAITPREAARLQSFNDDFYFCGNKTQICKQIGNAVPPLLAKAIADYIIFQIKHK